MLITQAKNIRVQNTIKRKTSRFLLNKENRFYQSITKIILCIFYTIENNKPVVW